MARLATTLSRRTGSKRKQEQTAEDADSFEGPDAKRARQEGLAPEPDCPEMASAASTPAPESAGSGLDQTNPASPVASACNTAADVFEPQTDDSHARQPDADCADPKTEQLLQQQRASPEPSAPLSPSSPSPQVADTTDSLDPHERAASPPAGSLPTLLVQANSLPAALPDKALQAAVSSAGPVIQWPAASGSLPLPPGYAAFLLDQSPAPAHLSTAVGSVPGQVVPPSLQTDGLVTLEVAAKPEKEAKDMQQLKALALQRLQGFQALPTTAVKLQGKDSEQQEPMQTSLEDTEPSSATHKHPPIVFAPPSPSAADGQGLPPLRSQTSHGPSGQPQPEAPFESKAQGKGPASQNHPSATHSKPMRPASSRHAASSTHKRPGPSKALHRTDSPKPPPAKVLGGNAQHAPSPAPSQVHHLQTPPVPRDSKVAAWDAGPASSPAVPAGKSTTTGSHAGAPDMRLLKRERSLTPLSPSRSRRPDPSSRRRSASRDPASGGFKQASGGSKSAVPAVSPAGSPPHIAAFAPRRASASDASRRLLQLPHALPGRAPPVLAHACASPLHTHQEQARRDAARGPPVPLPLVPGPQDVLVNPAAFDLLLSEFRDAGVLWGVFRSHGQWLVPRQVATGLLALATLTRPHQRTNLRQLQPDLIGLAMQHASSFTAAMASDAIWALGKLEQRQITPLLEKLSMQLVQFAPQLEAEHLAATVWGLAAAQHHAGATLLAALQAQVTARLSSFRHEHAHDVILGFATMEADLPGTFVASVAAKLVQGSSKPRPKSFLQAVLVAHSMGGPQHADMLQQVPKWLDMSELTLAEAAAVVAMYADHDYSPGLALLDGSAARVLQKESHRSRKALVHLLIGWARLDYRPEEEVLAVCIEELLQGRNKLRHGEVADAFWALARLDAPPGAEELLLKELAQGAGKLTADQLSHSLWAAALCNCATSHLWQPLILALSSRRQHEFSQGALVSLHLARELSQARSAVHACSQPDSAPKSLSWPAPLMAAAEQAMCDETEGATGHSDSVAQQIAETLTELDVPHVANVVVDAKLHVELQLTNAVQAAILVHGPCDFAQNNPQIPLGRTIMKRQLLKAAGWTVMSIPGHEWCRVSHSWKLRKQYMQCLLRMHAYGDA